MIKSFTDLLAWQSSHKLSLRIYEVSEDFPAKEQFGLSSQIRRAAVSVTSNLAEGFGRASRKDQEHFYTMASGSLYELKNQLILARDLKYLAETDFTKLADLANQSHKLIHGLLRAHKSNV